MENDGQRKATPMTETHPEPRARPLGRPVLAGITLALALGAVLVAPSPAQGSMK